jgi:hypothetical protein
MYATLFAACRKTIPLRAKNMSELQSNEIDIDADEYIEESESNEDEVAEDESESDPSDLAPDSDSEHEEKPERQINAKAQEVINKKHWEAKENERKYLEAMRELEHLKSQQQQSAPEVPPVPDLFDDDYESKLRQRDEALRQRVVYDTQQEWIAMQRKQEQELSQQAHAKLIYEKQLKYTSRAKELGISEQDLQQAGQAIAHYGLKDDLVIEILDDADGALIARHLAANPIDIEALNGMSSYQAARYIEKIRPKLEALKPKRTKAPSPATKLEGKASDPESRRYKHLGNAKFE